MLLNRLGIILFTGIVFVNKLVWIFSLVDSLLSGGDGVVSVPGCYDNKPDLVHDYVCTLLNTPKSGFRGKCLISEQIISGLSASASKLLSTS